MMVKKIVIISVTEVREALVSWAVDLYKQNPELLTENIRDGDTWNFSEKGTSDSDAINRYMEFELGTDLASQNEADQVVVETGRTIPASGITGDQYRVVYDVKWNHVQKTHCEDNTCERPGCHRCFPQLGCNDHLECRQASEV